MNLTGLTGLLTGLTEFLLPRRHERTQKARKNQIFISCFLLFRAFVVMFSSFLFFYPVNPFRKFYFIGVRE